MAQDNPILDMGLLNMMQPNKYIDPKFAGKPLPVAGVLYRAGRQSAADGRDGQADPELR